MAKLPAAVAASVARRAFSPFERHGIDHLSASSLNAWIAEPAFWVMSYLLNARPPVGCAAHRGTAAEAGISHGLFNPAASVTDCAILAMAKFDELAAGSADPKRDEERGNVAGMVREGLAVLRPYGVPTRPDDMHQHRVEIRLDGVPVPIIGFLDFEWSRDGQLVDTKTTKRVPSSFDSGAHLRQGAIYQHARPNSAVRFAYLSDKKSAVHTLEPDAYRQAMRELEQAGRRLAKFLALSTDAHELAAMVTPNFDDFRWNDAEALRLRRQYFGA